VQYAASTTVVDVSDLRVEEAKVDYVHTAQTKQKKNTKLKKGQKKRRMSIKIRQWS
jgi:hypothetical protein